MHRSVTTCDVTTVAAAVLYRPTAKHKNQYADGAVYGLKFAKKKRRVSVTSPTLRESCRDTHLSDLCLTLHMAGLRETLDGTLSVGL